MTIIPLRCVDCLLKAWQKHGFEVLSHLDKYVLAMSAVLSIQGDNGMACCPATSEEINYTSAWLRCSGDEDGINNSM